MDAKDAKAKEIEKRVIENYQNDERMMILIFAQWCVNNKLDAKELYKKAYPNQLNNTILDEVIEETVPKNEADEIPTATVLQVLQLFGNDDLAFVVQEEVEKLDD
ncbi:hypothetical protein [Oceanobacillus alkalisoli]|uniref:hypothetical protein n=1 Tax=Oceanobacillus alkalisoli TaxID=2925113 RepID=UPI001EF02191|nr:hypothetical protein [Oceanobacillus alkalisoli]MCF3944616.1 hypothetical protein [Oceanobacillus alkalisoli]MCG5104802.1 hypothetical protein [Oceanobacillus alkalisoli]